MHKVPRGVDVDVPADGGRNRGNRLSKLWSPQPRARLSNIFRGDRRCASPSLLVHHRANGARTGDTLIRQRHMGIDANVSVTLSESSLLPADAMHCVSDRCWKARGRGLTRRRPPSCSSSHPNAPSLLISSASWLESSPSSSFSADSCAQKLPEEHV
ncbi:hypothetical protein F441_10942 [Phytophthora nicotianae CJ01A1]|uniref:Uncharacterized protein n=2 Tax=Phytophthora nicotianae TaxID=4792 RepID=W2GMQ3_PHYNI|nr:hypothetical protein L915_10738 [Phytophthora nicotianae]ETL37729.1 hypothetical protein L916_10633 [Phytophthora nicotianae]ETP14095.1 hypothetical protein F441_10942 [Phytophthora nicotianae CJ01A1]